MRFPWAAKPESDPSQSAQEEFWRQWERFGSQSFAEIEDPADARMCLHLEVCKLSTSGNFQARRDLLRQGIERFPEDAALRLMLAIGHQHEGDNAAALLELSVLLATRPDYFVAHTHLARLLLKQGRREEARAVLEAGWRYAQHGYRGRELAERKAEFFSILDRPVPVPTEDGTS